MEDKPFELSGRGKNGYPTTFT